MNTPTTAFRLEKKVVKGMDKLITNPPSIVVDGIRGAARNRTELVELLVKHALKVQEDELKKATKDA